MIKHEDEIVDKPVLDMFDQGVYKFALLKYPRVRASFVPPANQHRFPTNGLQTSGATYADRPYK